MTSPQEVHKIIQNQFKNHFYKEDVTEIEKYADEPKPLVQIITNEEIAKALTKMSNQNFPGKGNIAIELIKNAPNFAHQQILMIMNNTLSEHDLNDLGTGILSPLPESNTER